MNYKAIYDRFIRIDRELGIKPVVNKSLSYKEKAKRLRKLNIDSAKYFLNHPISGRDCKYNLRAYLIMSDKEILMSEEREKNLRKEEFEKFLRDLRKFEEESRNSNLEVRACA